VQLKEKLYILVYFSVAQNYTTIHDFKKITRHFTPL